MAVWEIIWAVLISFSLISFIYMSIKILFGGWGELKFMLSYIAKKGKEL